MLFKFYPSFKVQNKSYHLYKTLLQATQISPSPNSSACVHMYFSLCVFPSQPNLACGNPLFLKSAFTSHLGNNHIHSLGIPPVPLFYIINFCAFLSWCPNPFMNFSRQVILLMSLILCNSWQKVGKEYKYLLPIMLARKQKCAGWENYGNSEEVTFSKSATENFKLLETV